MLWCVTVGFGLARVFGTARPGRARRGTAWYGMGFWLGPLRRGEVWYGYGARLGELRLGAVRHGTSFSA